MTDWNYCISVFVSVVYMTVQFTAISTSHCEVCIQCVISAKPCMWMDNALKS